MLFDGLDQIDWNLVPADSRLLSAGQVAICTECGIARVCQERALFVIR